MPEVVSIAILNFLKFGAAFAILYFLYRLIRFLLSRIPEGAFGNTSEQSWDGIELLYRIPSSIFGFLVMDFLVIGVMSSLVANGIPGILFGGAVGVWWVLTDGMDSFLGIIGCAGMFAATVFGIYQDHPPTRMKALVVIAAFSGLVGIGFRLG